MSTTERQVTYAYTSDYPSLREALNQNCKYGRQWISTSIHKGRERLKFAILNHVDSLGYVYVNGYCIGKSKAEFDAGVKIIQSGEMR